MQKNTTIILFPLFFITSIIAMDNPLASPIPQAPLWSKKTAAKIGGAGTFGAFAGGFGWVKTLQALEIDSSQDPKFFIGSTLFVSFSSGLACGWSMYTRSPNAAYHQARSISNKNDEFNLKNENDKFDCGPVINKLNEEHLVDYPLPSIHRSLEGRRTKVHKAIVALEQVANHPDSTDYFSTQSKSLKQRLVQIRDNIEACQNKIESDAKYETDVKQRNLQAHENRERSYAKKGFFNLLTEVAKTIIIQVTVNWFGEQPPAETVSG